jgi:hypothetical protein
LQSVAFSESEASMLELKGRQSSPDRSSQSLSGERLGRKQLFMPIACG